MISIGLTYAIAKVYPDNCIIMGIQDEETKLWSSALIEVIIDQPGDTIFSFEIYKHIDQMSAMEEMNNFCSGIKNTVTVQSN